MENIISIIEFSAEKSEKDLLPVHRDNGEGISGEDRKRLFNSLESIPRLACFLPREILTITGISIRETSEPGNGLRFGITVPGDMASGKPGKGTQVASLRDLSLNFFYF
jgi:hypothetical protein